MIRLLVSPLSRRPPPPIPPPPPPPPLPLPFTGDGLSSLDFRFSGRGGKKAVGDVDGVLVAPDVVLLAAPDDEFVEDEDPVVVDAVVVTL